MVVGTYHWVLGGREKSEGAERERSGGIDRACAGRKSAERRKSDKQKNDKYERAAGWRV